MYYKATQACIYYSTRQGLQTRYMTSSCTELVNSEFLRIALFWGVQEVGSLRTENEKLKKQVTTCDIFV